MKTLNDHVDGSWTLPEKWCETASSGRTASMRSFLLSPLAPFDFCSPPRGRLAGNCPLGQVPRAIQRDYSANYSPIHEVPFGRRDAQPQDFACSNVSLAAGFGQFRVARGGSAATARARSSCVRCDAKRAAIAPRPSRSARAPGLCGPARAAGGQRASLVLGANHPAAVNPRRGNRKDYGAGAGRSGPGPPVLAAG